MKASMYNRVIPKQWDDMQFQADTFIRQHIPRFHQFLMLAFPFTRRFLGYGLARDKEDPKKLTLLRGKKIIARNYHA